MKVLVTGGCGFIGSALVRRLVRLGHDVVNIDRLTYAATPEALEEAASSPRYRLVRGDICDRVLVAETLEEHRPDAVAHLAAESHVDRSIAGPDAFLRTNVCGTFTLLEAVRAWRIGRSGEFRFLHVSTDEVWGDLGPADAPFDETSPCRPNSPYAASKAASDMLVRAWGVTYGVPVLTTNCSNNFGPWQYPEKLIPLMITNASLGRALPVYGTGENVRDWLHVEDHADALISVLQHGTPGRTYAIGGGAEMRNIDIVRQLCALMDRRLPAGAPHAHLITHVTDRRGHDRRYAVDATRMHREIGWSPRRDFTTGLAETVDWYLGRDDWWRPLRGVEATREVA